MLKHRGPISPFAELITGCSFAISQIRIQPDIARQAKAITIASRELAALQHAANTQSGVAKATLELLCLQLGQEIEAAATDVGPTHINIFGKEVDHRSAGTDAGSDTG